MNSTKFRKELIKIMPGYKWTIHRKSVFTRGAVLSATGIVTSGFNRISTLEVTRRQTDDGIEYDVRSAGFGKRAPWLAERTGKTLAQALRQLQNHYETMGQKYSGHAADLQI